MNNQVSKTLMPFAAAVFCCTATLARTEEMVSASGRIAGTDGKPLAEAVVAVYDEKSNVIAHGKTDAEGRYTLQVPKSALHLVERRSSGGGNVLGGLLKGAGKIVQVAAPVATMAMGGGSAMALMGGAGGLNPLKQIGGAALSGGIPGLGGRGFPNLAGLGAMRGGAQMKMLASQMRAAGISKESLVSQWKAAGMEPGQIDQLLKMYGFVDSESGEAGDVEAAPEPNAPGALVVKASSAGHKELAGIGRVVWMHEETVDGGKGRALAAVIEPIRLADAESAESSDFQRGGYSLYGAALEPSIVEMGQTLVISVKLRIPAGRPGEAVVVARNVKTGKLFELKAADGGVHRAEIPIDKSWPKNEQVISLLAYAAGKDGGRDTKAEEEIEHAGLWKQDKPYVFNPLCVVSRNRIDLKLTVVEPNK